MPYSQIVNARPLLCFGAILVLAACSGKAPELYAPPIDRKPLQGFGAELIGHYVNMKDANAEAYFVSGISQTLEGGLWRWTYPNPELRFFLETAEGWKFAMDFGVSATAFPETGPITLSYSVNKHFLDRITYDHAGPQHFEKAVPASSLLARAVNIVSIEQDKFWVSKVDGARLGFTLIRAGFLH